MNKFALITGASSGIGAAYADRLAARGHNLVLVARRRDRLEALAERIGKTYGRKVEVLTADLGKPADLSRVADVLRARADIEILVNNAGLGALGPTASVDPEAVEEMVRINVLALTRLCLAVSPRFAQRKSGTIINIGSIIGVMPTPGGGAYSGSKAYVLNFSRSMQMEFAETNVRVQVVMPGPVRTEFFGGGPSPFPDHLFMTAETLVDTALTALDLGELICFPTLSDVGVWDGLESARRALSKAITQNGIPAARYAAPKAHAGA